MCTFLQRTSVSQSNSGVACERRRLAVDCPSPGGHRRAVKSLIYLLYRYTISPVKSAKTTAPDRAGLPSVFSYSKARAAGISSDRLLSYRVRGLVEQIGRGLYRWADAPAADMDLLEIAHRSAKGTLCLVTALARHGLTDVIPAHIDVAVPRGSRIPILSSPAHFHVFASATFDLGREVLDVGAKSSIGLYTAERTLVDVIRLRHREGADIAWEALRRWLRRKGSKPATLIKMAAHFHGAEQAIRGALDVVQ